MLNGHVIGNCIAINYCKGDRDDHVHFLTHIETGMRTDELTKVISLTAPIIYTSPVNAYILKTYFKCDRHIEPVPLGKTKQVYTKNGNMFIFTCFRSFYNCGSITLMINGDFGSVLYTGLSATTYDQLFVLPVKESLLLQPLSKLFLDCTYYNSSVEFSSVVEVKKALVKFFQSRKITFYIHVPIFGLEDVLAYIAFALKEVMVVDERRMTLVSRLGLSKYFSVDKHKGRLNVISQGIMKKNSEDEVAELVYIKVINDLSSSPNIYVNNGKIHFFTIFPHCTSTDCSEIINSTKPEVLIPLGYIDPKAVSIAVDKRHTDAYSPRNDADCNVKAKGKSTINCEQSSDDVITEKCVSEGEQDEQVAGDKVMTNVNINRALVNVDGIGSFSPLLQARMEKQRYGSSIYRPPIPKSCKSISTLSELPKKSPELLRLLNKAYLHRSSNKKTYQKGISGEKKKDIDGTRMALVDSFSRESGLGEVLKSNSINPEIHGDTVFVKESCISEHQDINYISSKVIFELSAADSVGPLNSHEEHSECPVDSLEINDQVKPSSMEKLKNPISCDRVLIEHPYALPSSENSFLLKSKYLLTSQTNKSNAVSLPTTDSVDDKLNKSDSCHKGLVSDNSDDDTTVADETLLTGLEPPCTNSGRPDPSCLKEEVVLVKNNVGFDESSVKVVTDGKSFIDEVVNKELSFNPVISSQEIVSEITVVNYNSESDVSEDNEKLALRPHNNNLASNNNNEESSSSIGSSLEFNDTGTSSSNSEMGSELSPSNCNVSCKVDNTWEPRILRQSNDIPEMSHKPHTVIIKNSNGGVIGKVRMKSSLTDQLVNCFNTTKSVKVVDVPVFKGAHSVDISPVTDDQPCSKTDSLPGLILSETILTEELNHPPTCVSPLLSQATSLLCVPVPPCNVENTSSINQQNMPPTNVIPLMEGSSECPVEKELVIEKNISNLILPLGKHSDPSMTSKKLFEVFSNTIPLDAIKSCSSILSCDILSNETPFDQDSDKKLNDSKSTNPNPETVIESSHLVLDTSDGDFISEKFQSSINIKDSSLPKEVHSETFDHLTDLKKELLDRSEKEVPSSFLKVTNLTDLIIDKSAGELASKPLSSEVASNGGSEISTYDEPCHSHENGSNNVNESPESSFKDNKINKDGGGEVKSESNRPNYSSSYSMVRSKRKKKKRNSEWLKNVGPKKRPFKWRQSCAEKDKTPAEKESPSTETVSGSAKQDLTADVCNTILDSSFTGRIIVKTSSSEIVKSLNRSPCDLNLLKQFQMKKELIVRLENDYSSGYKYSELKECFVPNTNEPSGFKSDCTGELDLDEKKKDISFEGIGEKVQQRRRKSDCRNSNLKQSVSKISSENKIRTRLSSKLHQISELDDTLSPMLSPAESLNSSKPSTSIDLTSCQDTTVSNLLLNKVSSVCEETSRMIDSDESLEGYEIIEPPPDSPPFTYNNVYFPEGQQKGCGLVISKVESLDEKDISFCFSRKPYIKTIPVIDLLEDDDKDSFSECVDPGNKEFQPDNLESITNCANRCTDDNPAELLQNHLQSHEDSTPPVDLKERDEIILENEKRAAPEEIIVKQPLNKSDVRYEPNRSDEGVPASLSQNNSSLNTIPYDKVESSTDFAEQTCDFKRIDPETSLNNNSSADPLPYIENSSCKDGPSVPRDETSHSVSINSCDEGDNFSQIINRESCQGDVTVNKLLPVIRLPATSDHENADYRDLHPLTCLTTPAPPSLSHRSSNYRRRHASRYQCTEGHSQDRHKKSKKPSLLLHSLQEFKSRRRLRRCGKFKSKAANKCSHSAGRSGQNSSKFSSLKYNNKDDFTVKLNNVEIPSNENKTEDDSETDIADENQDDDNEFHQELFELAKDFFEVASEKISMGKTSKQSAHRKRHASLNLIHRKRRRCK